MKKADILDELKADLKFNRKKFVLALIAITLFLMGYSIAPAPLPDGMYDVRVEYSNNVDIIAAFSVELDSGISFPQNYSIYRVDVGEYSLIIQYYKIYPGKIGESITFEAIVQKTTTGLQHQNTGEFKGWIENGESSLEYTPANEDDSGVYFEIRILKNSDVALGLLFAISFLWLTELIPLAASSLIIPVVIVLSDIDGPTGAFANFANPVIFLFLAGFLMAEAMNRSGLDRYIATRIIAITPARPKILMLTFMILTAIFSMFMSNTAAVAILIPIALTLFNEMELTDQSYKRAMVLAIAYSATVGGIGTMIGTAPNIIAVEFIKEYNPALEINFVEWMYFGVPVVAIMIPVVFFYLWFKFKPSVNEQELLVAKKEGLKKMKTSDMNLDQLIVSLIFALIIGLWLTSSYHGISASVVAVIGAILFFFTGQIKSEDFQKIGWSTLITFGGGLSLGYVIIETGLADYIALQLSDLVDLNKLVIMAVIAGIALLLTAVASNTASAAILIPIAMPLALILGINPIQLAILIAIVCSLDFAMVIGTPPTMLAFNTGLYKVKEIFNIGVVLDFIGLVVVLLLSWTLFALFVGIV